ncbi:MAG: deoxyribose-phosphate aldolase [Calditrichaeota bacterium]|nr:deoxyribose-phosphate aldolase [Calditrichota bacterium]
MTKKELARLIDHTNLKPESTTADIKKLCDEALQFGFASVCVNSLFVPFCAEKMKNSRVKVCAVVGFPLGANSVATKVREAEDAIKNGAEEIDMVIAVGKLKEGDDAYVENDIRQVVTAAKNRAHVKVIIETCLLTREEKIRACEIAQRAGAHFVKTSTGFNKAGATAEDVALMRSVVGDSLGVKAAGGIRTFRTALEMVNAGASRIGASASVQIINEIKE